MIEALLLGSRAVHYAASIGLGGVLCFAVLVARPPDLAPLFRRLAWLCLAVALVSGFGWFLALAAGMSSGTLVTALDPHVLATVLLHTQFGRDFGLRLILAVMVAALLLWQARPALPLALLFACCLLGMLAWAGHGADDTGANGVFHISADIVHLLAAGAWIGGLLPLVLLFQHAISEPDANVIAVARRAAQRFSALGIVAVGALLATGIINATYLVGSLAGFFGTDYGRLLLLKIALFALLVGIATFNREILVPRLHLNPRGGKQREAGAALRSLRNNSVLEVGLGLGVLGIVALLGTMVPAAHEQALWPFPIRFSSEALAAPELRGEMLIALATLALGLLLAGASFFIHKLWGAVIVLWLVIIAFFLPSLALLTAEAYPTSFFRSPTGFTAHSVALGAMAFAQNCASCHGVEGKGDGPAGKGLSDPPADLTTDHVYAHSDGEMFWWIGHGITDTPMPGFADVLDETTRWNLIDFIHANADGVRAPQGIPAQAPDFAVECPNGDDTDLNRLRPKLVHLVFAGPDIAARLDALRAADLGADVTTVIAGDTAARQSFCIVADAGVAEAYALYPPRGQSLASAEFLIDGRGWIRAIWIPALGAGWRDTAALQQEIAGIRANPIAGPVRAAGHVHGG
jgi:putative copper export protein/mono/diheme cytochrome c family protein